LFGLREGAGLIDTASASLPVVPLRISGARALGEDRLAVGLTAAAVALIPLVWPSGPGNSAYVDPLIALSFVACLLWAGTSAHLWRFPFAVGIGLFMTGGALGALAGPVPWSGVVALLQDLVLLAWCWAIANLCSSPQRLKLLLATWAYSSIGWAVLLFIGLATGTFGLTGQSTREASRTALTFGDPSFSANYYLISMMVIWATGRPRHRALRLLAYALLVSALLSTGSNSGIVSLIVGTVVAGLLGLSRRRGTLSAFTALAFVLVGGVLAVSTISVGDIQARAHESHYAFLRDGIGRSEVSESQRGMLLEESTHLYSTGGSLGQGPVSTKARLDKEMAPFIKEAHNDYFAALVERGAVGFVGLLLFLSALGLRAVSLIRGRLAKGFAAVIIRPNALVGAVAGTMVASTVYELLHLRHLWVLFAFVAAISLWGRE
jgi:hypothetical protein